jgi:hypothetical protein
LRVIEILFQRREQHVGLERQQGAVRLVAQQQNRVRDAESNRAWSERRRRAGNRFDTIPSRPILQARRNTVAPSSSVCSLKISPAARSAADWARSVSFRQEPPNALQKRLGQGQTYTPDRDRRISKVVRATAPDIAATKTCYFSQASHLSAYGTKLLRVQRMEPQFLMPRPRNEVSAGEYPSRPVVREKGSACAHGRQIGVGRG